MDWNRVLRIIFRVLGFSFAFIPTILFWIMFANILGYDYRFNVVAPTLDKYSNNEVMKDYYDLAAKSGYRKYGIYGNVNVSMRQFGDLHEEIDTTKDYIYPYWLANDRDLGLVWFQDSNTIIKEADVKDSLDYALFDITATDYWKRFKNNYESDWQVISQNKDKLSLFKHTKFTTHSVMKTLRRTSRIVVEFEELPLQTGQTNLSSDLKTHFQNNPHYKNSFSRNRNPPDFNGNRFKDHDSYFALLNKYYDNLVVTTGNETTLIFPPNANKNIKSNHFGDLHYSYYEKASHYLTFYDLISKDKSSAAALLTEMRNTAAVGTKFCFTPMTNTSTTQWCTQKKHIKEFVPSISPDFTGANTDASKCWNSEKETCKRALELLVQPSDRDFVYKSCDGSVLESGQRIVLSLLSLHKFNTALTILNNPTSKPPGYKSIEFKTKNTNPPQNMVITDQDDNAEQLSAAQIETLDYTAFEKIKFVHDATFDQNMSTWGGFRVGEDYYQIKCIVNKKFEFVSDGDGDGDLGELFKDAQVVFLDWNISWLGFFHHWAFSWIFVFVFALVIFCRTWGLFWPNGSAVLGIQRENPALLSLEVLVFFLFLTLLFSSWGFAHNHKTYEENVETIWGLTDDGKKNLESFASLSGITSAFSLVYVIVYCLDFLGVFELVASKYSTKFYELLEKQNTPNGVPNSVPVQV